MSIKLALHATKIANSMEIKEIMEKIFNWSTKLSYCFDRKSLIILIGFFDNEIMNKEARKTIQERKNIYF